MKEKARIDVLCEAIEFMVDAIERGDMQEALAMGRLAIELENTFQGIEAKIQLAVTAGGQLQ